MEKMYIGVDDFIGKKYGNVFFINESCIRDFANKVIYVFGAGHDGQIVYKLLRKHRIEVKGYLDNGVERDSYKEINGVKVENPNAIEDETNFFVIIASTRYDREMAYQLQTMGYVAGDDFGVWIFGRLGIRDKIQWELTQPFNHSFIYTWIRKNITDVIMGWLRKHRISTFYNRYETIDSLRDKYKGERCFILCTGPSLIENDLFRLDNEYTFGINGFCLLSKKLSWKPTFYFATNESFVREMLVNQALRPDDICREYMFVTDNCKSLCSYGNLTLVPMLALNPYYYSGLSPQDLRHSEDALVGLYEYSCTTIMCIDLAMYMGFSDIYILGADNDYLGDASYTSEIEGYEKKQERQRDFRSFLNYRDAILQMKSNEICYEYLGQIAKSKGIQIYNATRGGRLEVYPRVNLDEIL